MSETTTTVADKAAKKAVAAVTEQLPTVLETAELALEIPTKVALKTPVVVAVSVVAGTALGVAGLWGFNKLRTARATKKLEKKLATDEFDSTQN
jgi:hypothetical protein